jgi:alcohol dehydrogenase class IV
MRFEFTTPPRIVFGSGALHEAAPAARALGRHAFVVTGCDSSRATLLLEQLRAEKLSVTTHAIAG